MPKNSVKLVAKYWKTQSKQYVLIDASKSQGTFSTPKNPTMTGSNAAYHALDLAELYSNGIRNVKITAHYTVWYQWNKSSSNPDYATASMSWYSQQTASDAYKIWSYSDSFTNGNNNKKSAVYSTSITLNSSTLYVCRYQSYSSSYSSETHANWTDFWVEVEYPDMTKLY